MFTAPPYDDNHLTVSTGTDGMELHVSFEARTGQEMQ